MEEDPFTLSRFFFDDAIDEEGVESVLVPHTTALGDDVLDQHRDGDLKTAMGRIASDFPVSFTKNTGQSVTTGDTNVLELQRRTKLIVGHMGSMAKCRGANGDALREAGAIDSLLSVLHGLIADNECKGGEGRRFPLLGPLACENSAGLSCYHSEEKELDEAIELAIAALGAVRDLACGSALNRAAVLNFVPPPSRHNDDIGCCANRSQNGCCLNGIEILAQYVRRYHERRWEDILCLPTSAPSNLSGSRILNGAGLLATASTNRGKRELRLLTNAAGAIRNVSHSTRDNCTALHQCGVTNLLIWRLLHGSQNCSEFSSENGKPAFDSSILTPVAAASLPSLPDPSLPWREASFRIAGSLINLAEKCPHVATQCGSDLILVRLLVEAWGGSDVMTAPTTRSANRSTPLLHLGLAAVLHAADEALRSNPDGNGKGLDESLRGILDKEAERKRVAQRREDERKRRMLTIRKSL